MSEPSWIKQREEITQVFVRGTRRVELPLTDQSTKAKLGLLAALASRARFDLPEFPESFEPEENANHPDFMASVEIRSALCRYFRINRKSEQPLAAVYRVFDNYRKSGLHIHRFDYVQLKHLLALDPSLFDASFRRWASSRKSQNAMDLGEITDANWLEFSNPERVDYIARLHREAPGRARDLLSECFAQETANLRGKLLMAIEASVSIDDKAFLQSLAGDRAKSVQEILDHVLGCIANTEQYNRRFEEAASRLSLKVSKILKKRTLEVDQPAGYKGYRLAEWYSETFQRIDPMAFANHLSIEADEFCELIENSELAAECIAQLARQQQLELMVKLASRHSHAFMKWVETSDSGGLQSIDDKAKSDLWNALLENASMAKFEIWLVSLHNIYLELRTPIPSDISKNIVANQKFRQGMSNFFEQHEPRYFDIVETLVSVLHVDSHAELMASLNGVSPVYTSQAQQLVTLIKLLESDQ